jgi:hypothetical protein
MRSVLGSSITLFVLTALTSAVVFAQTALDPVAKSYPEAERSIVVPSRALPFAVGESLTYEGKVSKIIRGISVADLTFTVDAANSGNLLITAEARSKGTLLKLFRYSFLQQMNSTIERDDFRVMRSTKHDVQKERIRDSEAKFDYDRMRVTYVETDPQEPMRPPRTIASGIEDITHDLVSGVYALRLLPLEVGKTFNLSVSDSGLVYTIPVRVAAREKQKTILGTVMCFRVEPEVFGSGRMIEREGSMQIWITDDPRRLPVRSVVNSSIGKIDIRLRSHKNLRRAGDTAR